MRRGSVPAAAEAWTALLILLLIPTRAPVLQASYDAGAALFEQGLITAALPKCARWLPACLLSRKARLACC